jgi:GTP diphosphokinase / guanosine-3',5'-bis(diphosphate) 3'-diphosphatase
LTGRGLRCNIEESVLVGNLDRALEIAIKAHTGQVDKGGEPYILHPLRVMLRMRTEAERIVAVLHDVVEDSDYTFDELRSEGFPGDVIEALEALTKLPGESRIDAAQRAARVPLARSVKLADNAENSDLSRISAPTQKDLDRIEEYRKVRAILEGAGAP